MPVFRESPEKLFNKVVVSAGLGYNSAQDGSVCKIKITSDEANLITGLDEAASKEIIIGDVDEYVDRIIEDCIRTMKEEEECYIEFLHPDYDADSIIPLKSIDCSEGCPDSSEIESNSLASGDSAPESTKSLANDDKLVKTSTNVKESIASMVKIQFKLLSFTREPEIWEMSITEKWRRANYHKQKGMELYAQGKYPYAFRRFSLTLKYLISLEHDVPSDQKESMDIKGLKLSSYLNIAACQMRHDNFESVVINSSKALKLQPQNAKALYRRGAAYIQIQEYEKAKEDLTAAQLLEPKNQAIVKQLQILKGHVQKLNQYYANAMKKMFS